MTIPNFDSNDNLPPGVYTVTWEEFYDRYGYTKHRKELLAGLKKGITHLKDVGCKCIWIDVSFITAKHRPSDFDACWDEKDVSLPFLETMHPTLLDFENNREHQKRIYKGELFPSTLIAGNNPKRTYLEFFQKTKDDKPKGIIKLIL